MNRWYGRLWPPDIPTTLDDRTILCLPIGSYEQHGPHLPLHTDTVIAERFTERLVDTYGDRHDLWVLPTIPYGLSLEHAWSPGTITLRLSLLASLLHATVGEHVRATPARRFMIINGHGGNRGALEPIARELQIDHHLRGCVVLHPDALAAVTTESVVPEVHAGLCETSIMLALAPEDVRLGNIPDDLIINEAKKSEIDRLVRTRGATWPWKSSDPRIATLGVTGGDPRHASAEIGEAILASALKVCDQVLTDLSE